VILPWILHARDASTPQYAIRPLTLKAALPLTF